MFSLAFWYFPIIILHVLLCLFLLTLMYTGLVSLCFPFLVFDSHVATFSYLSSAFSSMSVCFFFCFPFAFIEAKKPTESRKSRKHVKTSLPKTSMSPLNSRGWKTSFLLGFGLFSEVFWLVLGSAELTISSVINYSKRKTCKLVCESEE